VSLVLPRSPRGFQNQATKDKYQAELRAWCEGVLQINSRLDFKVSSRGWCYILEEHGLVKGDFKDAQLTINNARKSGMLPLDLCSEDEGRLADHIESIDDETPEEFAQGWVAHLADVHEQYYPISFWENLPVYIEMTVEKIDLKGLFSSVCAEFRIPITNVSGWSDINSRAAMMRRFAAWEAKGKQCVLLHCGDHDPGGLHISEKIRKNLDDVSGAVGWRPDNLTIDRFGLNADFIAEHGLTWIDNLETGSGGRLDDPKHRDHKMPYVQNYLAQHGARKVEANALVVRPEAGRSLCREAILRYIPEDAVDEYAEQAAVHQAEARDEVIRLLGEGAA
jgi:hypothetical protein